MKIAPLAIAHALMVDKKNLWNECKALGSITHPDIRASIAAYAVAYLMQYIIRDQQNHIRVKESLPILDIIKPVIDVELLECQNIGLDCVSARLMRLRGAMDSADILRQTTGCGFTALDSVAFSIGTFFRHPCDFRTGVLEAVNAGGDSDTHASIVGALIGLNCGLSAIPKEWRDFNPQFQETIEIGAKLNQL